MGLFENRREKNQKKTVPIWFMRQAGRYHDHYRNMKKTHNFMELCKNPELACEITLGPINDFNFDAAILFSDLLFPLEHLGLGLTYNPGPLLNKNIKSINDIHNLSYLSPASEFYRFQGEACHLLRDSLPHNTNLLGFVGAPFTLYTYATEGSHSGALYHSKLGLYDGRWEAFNELLIPSLLEEIRIQCQNGADSMCLFDTAAGELNFEDFKNILLPKLKYITAEFKKEFPDKKIIYYSKMTNLSYLRAIEDDNIDVLGIDWRHNLPEVLKILGNDYYIQGNLEPAYLGLPWEILQEKWLKLYQDVTDSNTPLEKWICGLGHGCLQWIPQENVRKSVELIQKKFLY